MADICCCLYGSVISPRANANANAVQASYIVFKLVGARKTKETEVAQQWDKAAGGETNFAALLNTSSWRSTKCHRVSHARRRQGHSILNCTAKTELINAPHSIRDPVINQRRYWAGSAFSLMVCEGWGWVRLCYNEMSVLWHDWRAAVVWITGGRMHEGTSSKLTKCHFVPAPKNSWGRCG